MKAYYLTPIILGGLATLAMTPAAATPITPVKSVQATKTSSATNVDWRYRYHHGHRERYWFGGRVIRHLLHRI